jgi:hypothetical protein
MGELMFDPCVPNASIDDAISTIFEPQRTQRAQRKSNTFSSGALRLTFSIPASARLMMKGLP